MKWSTNRYVAILGFLALGVVGSSPTARAQMIPRDEFQMDRPLEAAERDEVIDEFLKALDEGYVFPDTAAKMARAIAEKRQAKGYDAITSSKELAKTLTDDVREVSKDKHLGVRYSYEALPSRPEDRAERGPSPEDVERMRKFAARMNHGFEKVERLEGNVGYLKLRGFMGPEVAGEKAVAAMNMLADADALIIDLRENGGGDPAMVALITSYLFGPEPVHLNDLYWRPEDSTHQYWTLPHVPGRRFGPDRPVFVLTSGRTFSAAEEFTYNLKNLKRATIVGETTGGGAHPGGFRRLSDHFGAFIPSGRAINPVSKSNWEGTGVEPDMKAPADQALETAHLAALELVLKTETAKPKPDDPMFVEMVRREIERLKKAESAKDGAKESTTQP